MKHPVFTHARVLLLSFALGPLTAAAQGGNPLLITAEDRCAFNRVDDESFELALTNCRSAAEGGDMQAQFEMGELYYQGERIEQDLTTAIEWFEEASVQGHPAAQYRLGLMHYQGEGVERNLPQAYIILKMAAINGEDEAMDASDKVAMEMNREEIEMATQVLGTLFRNYLNQLRKEEYDRLFNGNGSTQPGVPLRPPE